LGLGGPRNWEAGFIYRLTARQRKQMASLLEFAGPPAEVYAEQTPQTIAPLREEESPVPTFLLEVVAASSTVTIHFREGEGLPHDLVILMPIPAKSGDPGYWLLYQSDGNRPDNDTVTIDLAVCSRCDDQLTKLESHPADHPLIPHVIVQVCWNGNSVAYPVRFDDKTSLPLLLVGRRPTEGELINYFLFGREPQDADDPLLGASGETGPHFRSDEPIDTRRILAYFIRRFTQAVPGIEAEIMSAAYSRKALESALAGPTSPLELAKQAFHSLSRAPVSDEPRKTPTAVGFQLVEILAALLRCRAELDDADLQACFTPVVATCRTMLDELVNKYHELQDESFTTYRRQFTGDLP
jgi:hypothetical protein